MPDKFKPGDLVVLNQFGVFILIDYGNHVGIVISESYNLFPPMGLNHEAFYTVYDILLDGELITMVPEEFMEMYEKYEEDNK